MSCLDEHNSKVDFIASMSNKYDYVAYRDFCITRGYEVMSFAAYALLIEPPRPPSESTAVLSAPDPTLTKREVIISVPSEQPCNICGGGKVL